jgi:hypothetical protein
LASPLWTACQSPAVSKVHAFESGRTPFVTVAVPALRAACLQAVSVKRTVHVTVPPALLIAPLSAAESCTSEPTTTGVAESVVATLGASFAWFV